MTNLYADLNSVYSQMGIDLTISTGGLSKMNLPTLLKMTDQETQFYQEQITAGLNKAMGKNIEATAIETGGRVVGNILRNFNQKWNERNGGNTQVANDAGNGVEQAGYDAANTKRQAAQMAQQTAWNKFGQQQEHDFIIHNFNMRGTQIALEANLQASTQFAAEVLNDTTLAGSLYARVSAGLKRPATKQEFAQAFGGAIQNFGDLDFQHIQEAGANYAKERIEVAKAAGFELPQEKSKGKEQAPPKETVAAASTGSPATSAPVNNGPLSEYAEALQEVNNNPRLQGVSKDQRNQILRNALELKMTSDKMLFFNEFKIRKDLDYKEFKKLDGFEDLFKNKSDFEEFEKKIDDKLKTKYAEKGINYAAAVSESQQLKIEGIKQSLAGIGGVEKTDDAQKGYTPNIGGKSNYLG